MAIEPLGSVMTVQSQTVQRPVRTSEAAENTEVSTPAQVANVDPVTVSVAKAEGRVQVIKIQSNSRIRMKRSKRLLNN